MDLLGVHYDLLGVHYKVSMQKYGVNLRLCAQCYVKGLVFKAPFIELTSNGIWQRFVNRP